MSNFLFFLFFDVFCGFMASGVFFLKSGGRTFFDYANFHQNPTDLDKNHDFSLFFTTVDGFHVFSLLKSSSWWSKDVFWSYRIIIWWSETITMVPCSWPTRHSSWPRRHSSWPREHSSLPREHSSGPRRHSSLPRAHIFWPRRHSPWQRRDSTSVCFCQNCV